MPLHLVKLCVGVTEISEQVEWQQRRLEQENRVYHVTRMVPRRRDEVLDGGSLYWVIRGKIAVRQRITEIEPFIDIDGIRRCRLIFDPQLVMVRPAPRRAFQGWRYLTEEDAPPDLEGTGAAAVPSGEMRSELIELGLI